MAVAITFRREWAQHLERARDARAPCPFLKARPKNDEIRRAYSYGFRSAPVVTHPSNLLADLIEAGLHTSTLVRRQPVALPVHAPDPLAHAVQFTIDAPSLAPVQAAVRHAAVHPVLEELNALVRTGGCALPEDAGIPRSTWCPLRSRRGRKNHSGDDCRN